MGEYLWELIVNVHRETRSGLSGRGGRQSGIEERVGDTVGGVAIACPSQRTSSRRKRSGAAPFERVMSCSSALNPREVDRRISPN